MTFKELFESGFREVFDNLRRLKDQLSAANKALKAHQQAATQAGNAAAQQARQMYANAQAARAMAVAHQNLNQTQRMPRSWGRSPAYTRGPATNMRMAANNYQAAVGTGNQDYIFNAMAQYNQAAKAYNRHLKGMQPPGRGGGGSSSGFNGFGSFLGLRSLTGVFSALGKLAGPLKIVTALVSLFAAAIKVSLAALPMYRSHASFSLGANMGAQAAAAAGYQLRIAGVDPLGFVKGINSSMESDGYASSFARQMGLTPYGNPFAGPNATAYGDKAMTVLKNFINEKDDLRAMQLSKAFPDLEGIAWMRYLSDSTKQKAVKDMYDSSWANPESMKRAAEAQYAYNRAVADFQDAWKDFATTFLPSATRVLEWLSNALNPEATLDPVFGPTDKQREHFRKQSESMREHSDAMQGHAKALKNNTEALNRTFTEGFHGGWGPRGRRAFPSGWGPMQFDAQAMGQGIKVGAYAI